MRSELETLIELQKTDTKIRRLKIAIETADERRAEIEREFEQHAFSIREIQESRDTAREQRAKLENELITVKTFIDRAARNLNAAEDKTQYELAMRESETLQKQVSKLETGILEAMTETEEAEKILAERADEVNSLESNREAALNEFDAELERNRKELETASASRKEVFATLSPKLAAVYNRLAQRGRDGIAVAEVANGTCSACFMALRPQMQVELKTSDHIITCESCSRILYIAPESKAASENV